MSCELAPEEEKLFDLLVKLVADFEQQHYPMREPSPNEMLRFLMEQRNLRQRDIVHLFGSSGIASEVINGKFKPLGSPLLTDFQKPFYVKQGFGL